LTLVVDVADRESSAATHLYVSFRAPDTGRCPVLDATVLVNGVELPQVSRGGEDSPAWVQIQSDPPDPCSWPNFGVQFSAVPTAWQVALTEIRISDESAAFVAELANLFVGPTLAFPAGDVPELHPGATVTLGISPPESTLVDHYASLTFVPDDPEAKASTFTVSNGDNGTLSVEEQNVTFVVPDVEPGPGHLVLSAQALRPQVLSCTGFAACDVPGDPYAFYSSAPLVAAVVP
jgi:hypothetical protein